ncbi:uncharacterized protein LOC126897417 isoform X2 [Daktulosphaira vitifoliae]|uniref:uncharacterized protein LOC126897417 isoform X2 n=1 Tax=Daktulosphaira vitifoliae TaxID=58002 RepID=UPI0021AACA80|nr:uncharacterized protein LOC126897417 isoform X2 [Daktulosphaira vitifoliae]
MKMYFANIILLVVLQKYEKVLTSSDFPRDTSISTNSDEPESKILTFYCAICQEIPMEDIFKTECCKKKFHFICMYDWSKYSNEKVCPLCNGKFVAVCKICNSDCDVNDDVTELECCKTKTHKKCIDYRLSNTSITCPNCNVELESNKI